MPEHIRALIAILVLASLVFAFVKRPACAIATTTADFKRRRNLWFGITLVAFLAHDFWIFILVTTLLLFVTQTQEQNKLALYLLLLPALPPLNAKISGMGVVNELFVIDYYRLLALTVLFPTYLSLRRQTSEPFGRLLPDKLMALYMILSFALFLGRNTFTEAVRYGVFYNFIDIFLPYYVASRSLKSIQQFRDALMAFAIASLLLSVIGAFEFLRHWLLYAKLANTLGVPWGFGRYLRRGDGIRAMASIGHPISLGYVIAVAIGFFLYLKKFIPDPKSWLLGLLLLILGMVSSISRGPWVGAMVIYGIFIATSLSATKTITKVTLVGLILSPALLLTETGQKIIDFLPFVGTVEVDNIDFRRNLLNAVVSIIMRHPFFGSANFMQAPELWSLRDGAGFIDIVNSFVGIALMYGLVGLALFVGFFVTIIFNIFKAMRTVSDRGDESYVLGQVLLATLLGILVMIFTVSSITIVPIIYWTIAGLGVAYASMLKHATVRSAA